jgi:hypothetical protein
MQKRMQRSARDISEPQPARFVNRITFLVTEALAADATQIMQNLLSVDFRRSTLMDSNHRWPDYMAQ